MWAPTTLEAAIKSVLFLAALIVLAGYTAAVAYAGVRVGRAREARDRNGVDPKWARQCEDFVREVVTPPATEAALNDMVVLPEVLRAKGRTLLYEAPGAAERRQRLRVLGY